MESHIRGGLIMQLYRIHTENKNRKWLEQIIAERFSGFSIQEQTGYWQGKKEKSLCIEIMSSRKSDPIRIQEIVKMICGYSYQDCVLVQIINLDKFLYSTGNGKL
jgi:hypothetical protein